MALRRMRIVDVIEQRLDRLDELLERMFRAMHRHSRDETWSDLTPHQFFLLRTLDGRGPMSLGALRQAGTGAQSTTSEMVGRLARAGYVRKNPAPEDRRAVVVAITPRGRAVVATRMAAIRERQRTILEALAREDQDIFLGAVETLAALIERAAGSVADGGEDDA